MVIFEIVLQIVLVMIVLATCIGNSDVVAKVMVRFHEDDIKSLSTLLTANIGQLDADVLFITVKYINVFLHFAYMYIHVFNSFNALIVFLDKGELLNLNTDNQLEFAIENLKHVVFHVFIGELKFGDDQEASQSSQLITTEWPQ